MYSTLLIIFFQEGEKRGTGREGKRGERNEGIGRKGDNSRKRKSK